MSHNLISIKDLSKNDVSAVFKLADKLQKREHIKAVNTAVVGALLFFEPSTRTQIGFEIAAWKQGIKSVVLQETKMTNAMSQAESIADTIRTLNPYVNYFCVRHPKENIFEEILPYTNHAVINCGNGYDEHPTQALIDTYTIQKQFGRLDNLTITIIGELKYGRAVHSLMLLMSNFPNVKIIDVSPNDLKAQKQYGELYGKNYTHTTVNKHEWGKEQIVYVAGFPPKNPSGNFSQKQRDEYKITKTIANRLAKDCIILNALPRIDEIDFDVDGLPSAQYFQQNEYGLYIRMAVIEKFCLNA